MISSLIFVYFNNSLERLARTLADQREILPHLLASLDSSHLMDSSHVMGLFR